MDKTNEQINILPNLKTNGVLYPMVGFIVILIIFMSLIFFKVSFPSSIKSKPLSNQEITANVFIVTFFVIIVLFLCIILLPNFKSLKQLFQQINNVTYVILYTIGIILLFTTTSAEFINKYASYITPITIGVGLIAFYKSLQQNYTAEFNINYERIKSVILMLCLITCYIIYYNKDPGGYISKYFGYTLLLTIIIAVFGLLYVITVLTLNDKSDSLPKEGNISNLMNNFSSFSVYGSIFFVIFLIIMTALISTYPGGFFKDKAIAGSVLIFILIICILWSILLVVNLFPEITNKTITIDKMNIFKRALSMLFGFVISGIIIFWIVYTIQNYSGQSSSILSLILNIFLVLIVLSFLYKTFYTQLPVGNTKKNALFNLIINYIFYIPCIFSGFFDYISKILLGLNYSYDKSSLLMLLLAIVIIVLYFCVPLLTNKISLQGGQQLVNQPVFTDTSYSLGTYEELNGSDQFDYQFAISFWTYIDSAGPNTNLSYNKFTSLLNFADKPNILYNANEHTLMITMEQKNLEKSTKNKLIDFDNNGNRIIYKNNNFLLQKWNNIIINYNGGVLDIFINGELVKSEIGVVPYYTLDNLTIGEINGIKGGICNVVYFRNALKRNNIYYLYNTVKNKTPPVPNDSSYTILKKNTDTVKSSAKTVINKI
jgi:hypothetical protein